MSASSDQICLASSEHRLQRNIQLANSEHFVNFIASRKCSGVALRVQDLTSYRDPGYGIYNCAVNLRYCYVLSTKLDSQIHWSSILYTEIHFISVPKKLKSRTANFNEHASSCINFVTTSKRALVYLIFAGKSSIKAKVSRSLENFKGPSSISQDATNLW